MSKKNCELMMHKDSREDPPPAYSNLIVNLGEGRTEKIAICRDCYDRITAEMSNFSEFSTGGVEIMEDDD